MIARNYLLILSCFLLLVFTHLSWVRYGNLHNAKTVDSIVITKQNINFFKDSRRSAVFLKFLHALYDEPVGNGRLFQFPKELKSINLDSLKNQGLLFEHEQSKVKLINYLNNIPLNEIYLKHSFTITVFSHFIFCFILSIILCFFCLQNKSTIFLRNYLTVQILIWIGFISYLIGLVCIYIFTFSDYDSNNLNSFSRYTATYLVGITIFTFGAILFFSDRLKGTKSKLCLSSTAILISIITFLSSPVGIFHFFFLSPPPIIPQRQAAINIKNNMIRHLKINDPFYLIWQNADVFSMFILRYELLPDYKIDINGAWSIVKSRFDNDSGQKSLEDFQKRLNGFNCLVVINLNSTKLAEYKLVSQHFTSRIDLSNKGNSMVIFQR